ncbi:MAG TPA: glycosyltransferase [Candidatus Marinimicrobia bacterium]|nr:glycosyltransferase [Candidatus Neomarinimicrobiota bacterium]HRS51363.1 glycosyltransferase [Candidatus Neomarinimicrobiota bacterium]HRU92265.1 glycosyltransferase [Candidatus Neomarinimicrobiota bacterium]
MDDPQKVSVIIPTYNREACLERAIVSVLNQTYRNFELIVIDDGSTDNTSRIIHRYKNKIRYYSQLHSGVSTARNLGLEKSEGTWVAFLDSDDYWLPRKLERQMQCLAENPKWLVLQTDEKWIRNGVVVNPTKKHQKYSGWIFAQCLPLCIVSPSAVIVHQKVFNDVGVFDESLPVCEDYDLWLRVSLKYEIGLLPEKLIVKTGGHSDQLSRKYWGIDRYRVLALEKILNAELDRQQTELVLDEIIKKLTILSKGRAKHPELPNIYAEKLSEYQKKKEAFLANQKCCH